MHHEGGHLQAGPDGKAWVGPITEGASVRLSCRVTGGRPTPAVSWWRGGKKIPSEQRYRRLERAGEQQHLMLESSGEQQHQRLDSSGEQQHRRFKRFVVNEPPWRTDYTSRNSGPKIMGHFYEKFDDVVSGDLANTKKRSKFLTDPFGEVYNPTYVRRKELIVFNDSEVFDDDNDYLESTFTSEQFKLNHTKHIDQYQEDEYYLTNKDKMNKRKYRNVPPNNRWWDNIKVPEPDTKEFNYTSFLRGNAKNIGKYSDQYSSYDPTKFFWPSVNPNEPTAEPVQTKPSTTSPHADIINSANYDKDVLVQSDVTIIATRDLVGATFFCRSEQTVDNGPKNLLEPMTMAVSFNITCECQIKCR